MMLTARRFVALAAGAAMLAVSHAGTADAQEDDASLIEVEQVASTPREDVPSALEDRNHPDFPQPLVDPEEIISGGPPPDGIPAIDEPRFLAAGDVDFLEDQEPVVVVEVEGDVRAYPMQIMTWHEIVNDTIGGVPVTVTYCPLCNSAIAYHRELGDRILDFGTSGLLFNSALVMYDRQTESLWSHFTAEGIVGALAGEELDVLPAPIVSWESFRDANPDGLVLSRETGHERNYGDNPYLGYDDVDSPPFLFDGEVDGRLAAKERVVGIGGDVDPVAVRRSELAEAGVLEVDIDGEEVVVWHLPGTASGLEGGSVAGGRDVGAVGVFRPVVDGQELTFRHDGEGFVDEQTSSRWDIFGRATSGPLEDSELEPVDHVDTFWFAWGAYQDDTRLVPQGAAEAEIADGDSGSSSSGTGPIVGGAALIAALLLGGGFVAYRRVRSQAPMESSGV
jgi:hypothetical protein